MPPFLLGEPQAYLPQSHILSSEFRHSCTRQKGCFQEKLFPLVAITLQKHGEHSPSRQVGWVTPSTPGWKRALRASVEREAEARAEHQALPSPACYLSRRNAGLINWKIKVIVKVSSEWRTLVDTYWILFPWTTQLEPCTTLSLRVGVLPHLFIWLWPRDWLQPVASGRSREWASSKFSPGPQQNMCISACLLHLLWPWKGHTQVSRGEEERHRRQSCPQPSLARISWPTNLWTFITYFKPLSFGSGLLYSIFLSL